MTNTDLTQTQSSNALTVADARSLIALALGWRVVDLVPDRLGQSIDALEGALRQGLKPSPLDAYVVLLDRLFTATERPPNAAIDLWRAQLDHFPEGVLMRAVEHVIGTHKWAGPPKVAQLVEAAGTDGEWADLKMVKLRMRTLKAAWDRQQASKGPNVPFNPDIAGTIQAAAYASQRAMRDRVAGEQAKIKAERKVRYQMSPAEEAKVNAEARAKAGMETAHE